MARLCLPPPTTWVSGRCGRGCDFRQSVAITGAGEVEGFSVGTRTVFYASAAWGTPRSLCGGFAGGEPRQLTHVNQAALAQRKLGEYEQFSFPAGTMKTSSAMSSASRLQTRSEISVAFLVHGGPQGSFANSWNWRWNAQTFAGAGYGVVMIDFHGSTGYGQAFTDSISGDWGGKPLEDLKARPCRGAQAVSLAGRRSRLCARALLMAAT